MTIATDEAGLVRALRAEPDNDLLRLIAADLFEDAGDSVRAAYVRAEVKSGRVQIQEYRDSPDWTWYWRRGFVERVVCPHDGWVEHGCDVLVMHPIARVELTDKRAHQDCCVRKCFFFHEDDGIEHSELADRRTYLDSRIFKAMLNLGYRYEYNDGISSLTSKKAAADALSAACLLYAENSPPEED